MRDSEFLITGILNNTIELNELTFDEIDLVHEELCEIAEDMAGTDREDFGFALLNALEANINERIEQDALFDEAILAAEARGSVYWEFDEYTLH